VQFLGGFGVLLSFSLGALLNWWQLAAALIALVPPFVIGMFLVPESPRWLLSRGREAEGRAALEWLRGPACAETDREVEFIQQELTEAKEQRTGIRDLLDPAIIKPFTTTIMLFFFMNVSGMNIMIFYCNSIFFYSGSSLDSNVASIIVAVVLLFSSFVAITLVNKLPRKLIMIVSNLVMAVCYIVLGACFHSIEQGGLASAPGHVGWLAPLSIITLLFFGNGGCGTLIWVVIAELLPPRVRATANAVVICFGFILGFIMSKTFVDLIGAINASGTFWLYGSMCVLAAAYTAACVPETRGKTIEEIQQTFGPRQPKPSAQSHEKQ
jgi:Na+/melibiose symporter-like transporter